ncbi:MAG TPA: sulfotransferase domain-containing protein [Verrucomicrobiae bacterium]|nr:sulfotransferase domain-containing protein [Verrucomicrobiae bacterium]
MGLKRTLRFVRRRFLFWRVGGSREHLQQYDADIFIISYPKSGRTWLRLMLGKYLSDLSGAEFSELLELYELTSKRKQFPRIGVIHDGSSRDGKFQHRSQLKKSKRLYRNKQVIFLARDPRDVAVSYYFHCSRREKAGRWNLSDFLRDENFGLPKIIHFMNIWAKNRATPKKFLLVHYEKLLAAPAKELEKVIDFIGVKSDPALLEEAVAFGAFDNMRQMELQERFGSDRLRPGCATDPESFKTRRGKAGGYADYLTDNDLKYANDLMAKELSPFFGYAVNEMPLAYALH